MKTQVIVVCAGAGRRFRSHVPKPLARLGSKPIIAHTLRAFELCRAVDSVILAAGSDHLERFRHLVRDFSFKKVVRVVAGGETRSHSVFCGLQALDGDTRAVVIHDGVRPFFPQEGLEKALRALKKYPAAILAVPVKPTIKIVNPKRRLVQKTLDRDKLWEVQTPQVFRRSTILSAYKGFRAYARKATDDAFLVERLGRKVCVVDGSYANIKITTPDDLLLAEKLLKG